MKMRPVYLAIVATFLSCGLVFAEPTTEKSLSVRTFQFKYKDADKAAAVIKSFLSPAGSISIQPSTNSLVVTDSAENLKQVAGALARFDAPARLLKLTVRLVSADRAEGSPRVPDDLKDIAPKLAMLRFNVLEDIGQVDVEGKEGEPGMIELGTGYRADFRFGEFDAASDSIKINDLHLSKLAGPQKDQLTSLLKTSLNLKLGQTIILGASRVPQSQHALMIVLLARR